MLKKSLLLCAAGVLVSGAVNAGSVQPLVNTAPEGVQLSFLLTDGRVLAQSLTDQHFFALTPDSFGSYANGTWSKVADLPREYAPYAGASAVLADGRVLLIGGEYNFGAFSLTNLGAIYDPKSDRWTKLEPPPGEEWAYIGDSAGLVLPDGRYLLGDKLNKAMAAYDPKTDRWTNLEHTGKSDLNAEEGWTLLPDGRVFTIDVKNHPNSEIYDPVTQTWTGAGSTGVDLVFADHHTKIIYGDHRVYRPPGEVGASMLLPDGSVFTAGARPNHEKTAHSAIYKNGVWSAGPDIPNGDDASDVGSVLLPSGNVLQETFGSTYEFDGKAFKEQHVDLGQAPLVLLPTGQVLVAGSEVYISRGKPKPSWAPTIASFPSSISPGGTYQISGTQFNGLSQANALGDELETFTNYPLVRITNTASGHVYYARTHDHSTMGVATGDAIVSTNFDVSSQTETGPGTLVVVANGIASQPVAVTVN